MSNDFRSLLSTFQAASSSCKSDAPAGVAAVPTVSCEASTLLEATTELWRIGQLKRSFQRSSHSSATTREQNSTSSTAADPPIHLAVCLCIVDELPHQDIWKYWIEHPGQASTSKSESSSASLYLHAKHPEKLKASSNRHTSEWTKSKLIDISHRPEWNDVRIVRAMLSLGRYVLDHNPRATQLYFGTESCLPIRSLQSGVLTHGMSYLAWYDKSQATRFEERSCWSPVEQFVPSDAIHKALPGWCVLSRPHLEAIVNLDSMQQMRSKTVATSTNQQQQQQQQSSSVATTTSTVLTTSTPTVIPPLWTAFTDCWAPEEVYFATALALLGVLWDDKQVKKQSLVHVQWPRNPAKEEDNAHPLTWDDDFDKQLVHRIVARNSGCIFLRKVKRRMPLSYWKQCVLDNDDGSARITQLEGKCADDSSHGAAASGADMPSRTHHAGDKRRRAWSGSTREEQQEDLNNTGRREKSSRGLRNERHSLHHDDYYKYDTTGRRQGHRHHHDDHDDRRGRAHEHHYRHGDYRVHDDGNRRPRSRSRNDGH